MTLFWITIGVVSVMLAGFSTGALLGEVIGAVQLTRDARQDLAILALVAIVAGNFAAENLFGVSGNE